MAYPKGPQGEDPLMEERSTVAPPMPPPIPLTQRPSAVGGAPKLPSAPELPPAYVKPFWQAETPEPPHREVLYAAPPWEGKVVAKQYDSVIERLAKTLWERREAMDPNDRDRRNWAKVGQNAQQVAQTLVTRALMNREGIAPRMLPEERRTQFTEDERWRWFQALRKGR